MLKHVLMTGSFGYSIFIFIIVFGLLSYQSMTHWQYSDVATEVSSFRNS